MNRGPNDRITLRHDSDEYLDEIVVSNCTVHLEQMDDHWYYLGIYDADDLLVQVSVRADRGKVDAMVYGAENTEGISQ